MNATKHGQTVPMSDRLLDTRELAAALRISERHAQELLLRGTITSCLLGRLRRVRESDLQQYIASLQPA